MQAQHRLLAAARGHRHHLARDACRQIGWRRRRAAPDPPATGAGAAALSLKTTPIAEFGSPV